MSQPVLKMSKKRTHACVCGGGGGGGGEWWGKEGVGKKIKKKINFIINMVNWKKS